MFNESIGRLLRGGVAVVLGFLVLLPGEARTEDFDKFGDVTYVERAGGPVKADVYVPRGQGPLPAVLVVHGGGWRGGSKERFGRVAEMFAAAGFTSVSIEYRLAPQHKFPAQIEDCKSAVRWMRKNAAQYRIDPERIGAFGYSAGGHLVALLGTTDASDKLEGPDADGTSTRLACAVAGGAPCDFRLIPSQGDRLAYWLGGSRAEKPEQYELASPQKFVTKDDPPMLLFHGDDDRLVPIFGAQTMVRKLKEAGVTAELFTIAGAGHGQALTNAGTRQEALRFFERHLKADKTASP